MFSIGNFFVKEGDASLSAFCTGAKENRKIFLSTGATSNINYKGVHKPW